MCGKLFLVSIQNLKATYIKIKQIFLFCRFEQNQQFLMLKMRAALEVQKKPKQLSQISNKENLKIDVNKPFLLLKFCFVI
jgi:hypothetical protein